jgi:hypothetical protein
VAWAPLACCCRAESKGTSAVGTWVRVPSIPVTTSGISLNGTENSSDRRFLIPTSRRLTVPVTPLQYYLINKKEKEEELKGQCHEMNNFYEGLKNQISTFFIGMHRWFQNFSAP